ncbi:hypothetical protein MAHJHV60_47380 [Mycobacterium avium subsp. hominissuis]
MAAAVMLAAGGQGPQRPGDADDEHDQRGVRDRGQRHRAAGSWQSARFAVRQQSAAPACAGSCTGCTQSCA